MFLPLPRFILIPHPFEIILDKLCREDGELYIKPFVNLLLQCLTEFGYPLAEVPLQKVLLRMHILPPVNAAAEFAAAVGRSGRE